MEDIFEEFVSDISEHEEKNSNEINNEKQEEKESKLTIII